MPTTTKSVTNNSKLNNDSTVRKSRSELTSKQHLNNNNKQILSAKRRSLGSNSIKSTQTTASQQVSALFCFRNAALPNKEKIAKNALEIAWSL